ncbi:MAG: DUF2779 domain-containing protein [Gemmatimonadales bacterium]
MSAPFPTIDCGMRTLSKSDFEVARTCITKLYYREQHYPETAADNPYLALLAEGGYMVEQLARLMFPDGVELDYGRDPVPDWETTRRHLDQDRVTLFEATLLSGVKQARVDILVKRGNHFDLIEVKSKSMTGDDLEAGLRGPFRGKRKPFAVRAPWRPYLEDVGYQTQLLRELFPDADIVPHLLLIDKAKTTSTEGLPGMFAIRRDVMVNGRKKDLDVRFTGDLTAVTPGEFLTIQDVSSEVDELMPEIMAETRRFATLYSGDAVRRVQEPLAWKCRTCEFKVPEGTAPDGFAECWGELASPSPPLFDLYQFGNVRINGSLLGNQLIATGKTSLDAVPRELLTTAWARRQLKQIEHTRTGAIWLDDCVHRELDELAWPLHFVDFETSLLAVPYHRGMRPYESVAFQWSCHTIRSDGAVPVHTEWLNLESTWPNAEFARTLRAAVGDSGRILTWSRYEGTVLTAIRDQLRRYDAGDPALIAWIDGVLGSEAVPARLFDLNDLCVRGFFHPDMRGRTSIKVVLDAVWQDNAMRAHYTEWTSRPARGDIGPYAGLPPVTVAGTSLNVQDGTDAMLAYTALLYGAEKDDPVIRRAWADLLLRYCQLDTLAMVLIWDYWRHNR